MSVSTCLLISRVRVAAANLKVSVVMYSTLESGCHGFVARKASRKILELGLGFGLTST